MLAIALDEEIAWVVEIPIKRNRIYRNTGPTFDQGTNYFKVMPTNWFIENHS